MIEDDSYKKTDGRFRTYLPSLQFDLRVFPLR